MKFFALIYNDETQYADATPEDIAATFQAHGEFGRPTGGRRLRRGGDGLQPTAAATTVACATASAATTAVAETRSSSAASTCSSARTSTRRSLGARIPRRKNGAIEVRR